MTITQDLHDRLRAALPDAVPVLRPEDAQTPLHAAPVDAQGRPVVGAGERGLGAYLQQHPQGYVQIGEVVGLGRGVTGRYWYPVTTLAPTEPTCAALADLVFTVLCGDPARAPGPYPPQFDTPPQQTTPGVWSSTLTVQARTLNGDLIQGA